MPYGLYISAEGAQAQSRRMETISNNLANANTAGFKRDLAIFQARHSEAVSQGSDYGGSRTVNDIGGGVFVESTATDFSSGPLNATKIPTDFAVRGPGFFVVQQDGKNVLTRAGNFMFSPEGMLTTQDGEPVLNDSLEPIILDPSLPWNLRADGALTQDGSAYRLALVEPASRGDLAKAGMNSFLPLSDPIPLADDRRRVDSGYLEVSQVKPAPEMISMIETSRAFEANVNMIRHHDQMLSALVGRALRGNS